MKSLTLAVLLTLSVGTHSHAQSVTPGPLDCANSAALAASLRLDYGLVPVIALLADTRSPGTIDRVIRIWSNPATGHWVITEDDSRTGVSCNIGYSFLGMVLTDVFRDLLDAGAFPPPGEAPAATPRAPVPDPSEAL